ncbi:iron donor protein CyaY [Glaesserella parasuis]|uniref:iron donor protein CyaY n=1 Tax=Glaesserella parasuis TaxID=738 RepID=UPI001361A14C|nr:iron donor protein CyaY [Glaesserella parasuis]MDG6409712.1 iron donor protein CyaY [Glaesserella parasuis]MDG6430948.1 iron donor protein CyaY [Glaesserella parasuis]MDG6450352.1 iron donor protein CyaY [Glaesserella parasuis]MDG6765741.1 iron donor protein CyaY [Glaesserella parasuis]MDO9780483.1 iron donor protein CyaY [Glaesserella parasuis]
MNLAEFHQAIEQVWEHIEEQLEEQGCDVDCETQGAVFTITFDDDSQIVINKQEAMLELWLASKLGGYHFAHRDGDWVSAEGRSFWTHLEEAVARHGEKISFS